MLTARRLFTLIAILCAGCSPIVAAQFPDVYSPPAVKLDATKIGLARVADSRRDESAGWLNGDITVVAGPAMADYIGRKFRSQMIEQGFAPIDSSDPAASTNSSAFKTVIVTLQSTNFGGTSTFLFHPIASTDIAVQVFAAGSRTIVFAQSYQGTHRGNGRVGTNLAAAADGAIEQAFADQAFLAALE